MYKPSRDIEVRGIVGGAQRYPDEADFIELCRIAWSYKLLLFCLVVLGGSIAATYAFTTPLVFRAEAVVVQVRNHDVGGGGSESVMDQLGSIATLAGVNLPTADSSAQEARAILQSKSLSRSFIDRYQLLGALMPPKPGQVATLSRAVDRFQSDVFSLRDDARKGTTTITMDWTNPAVAAMWANDYVALANEIIRARAMDDSNKDIAYLKKQLSMTTDVELQRVMYGLVESETKTLMLANSRPDYAFRVVDPAEPPDRRFRPKRIILLFLGVAAGLTIGLLVAFTHNRVRRSRQT